MRAVRTTASLARAAVGGLAAGLLAAVIAGGVGSRVLMRIIATMSRSHYGENTHGDAVVGLVTFDGTLSLLSQALFYGVPGAVMFAIFGRWIPGTGWRRGLLFGIFLIFVGGPNLLSPDNYEFHRYIPLALSIGMFALLMPLFGVVLVPLWRRLAGREPIRPRNRFVNALGYAAMGFLVVQGIVNFAPFAGYWH